VGAVIPWPMPDASKRLITAAGSNRTGLAAGLVASNRSNWSPAGKPMEILASAQAWIKQQRFRSTRSSKAIDFLGEGHTQVAKAVGPNHAGFRWRLLVEVAGGGCGSRSLNGADEILPSPISLTGAGGLPENGVDTVFQRGRPPQDKTSKF